MSHCPIHTLLNAVDHVNATLAAYQEGELHSIPREAMHDLHLLNDRLQETLALSVALQGMMFDKLRD